MGTDLRDVAATFPIQDTSLIVLVGLVALAMGVLDAVINNPGIVVAAFLISLVMGPIALMVAAIYWPETP